MGIAAGLWAAQILALLAVGTTLAQQQQCSPAAAGGAPVLYRYNIINEFTHDQSAFTQGLVYDQRCDAAGANCRDIFYESAGLYGESNVRTVDAATGAVLRRARVGDEFFAEGLAKLGGRLYQLTWQGPTGFAYAADTLAPLGRFATPLRDGWGAAADPGGRLLVLSDGSPVLTWVDPADSFRPVRSVTVRASGRPVSNLNELEFVGGDIYANVWTTECIARICPATGQVTAWILLQGLRARAVAASNGRGDVDVLNGIAWDAARRRLFVTGKKWPRLYELGLQSVPSTSPTVRQMAASCLQQPSWG